MTKIFYARNKIIKSPPTNLTILNLCSNYLTRNLLNKHLTYDIQYRVTQEKNVGNSSIQMHVRAGACKCTYKWGKVIKETLTKLSLT